MFLQGHQKGPERATRALRLPCHMTRVTFPPRVLRHLCVLLPGFSSASWCASAACRPKPAPRERVAGQAVPWPGEQRRRRPPGPALGVCRAALPGTVSASRDEAPPPGTQWPLWPRVPKADLAWEPFLLALTVRVSRGSGPGPSPTEKRRFARFLMVLPRAGSRKPALSP